MTFCIPVIHQGSGLLCENMWTFLLNLVVTRHSPRSLNFSPTRRAFVWSFRPAPFHFISTEQFRVSPADPPLPPPPPLSYRSHVHFFEFVLFCKL